MAAPSLTPPRLPRPGRGWKLWKRKTANSRGEKPGYKSFGRRAEVLLGRILVKRQSRCCRPRMLRVRNRLLKRPFYTKTFFLLRKSLSKSTRMASKEMYFAFGSNLNPERMKQRKAFFTARVGAKLVDHKFSFSFKRPDGTGAGNIRPQKSSVVYGALYTLEEGGLDKLDVFEWVDRGCYRRQNVTVETLDGERVEATTYVVTEDFYEEGLLPRRDYLNHCLACKDVVPTEYYAFLESFKEICHD